MVWMSILLSFAAGADDDVAMAAVSRRELARTELAGFDTGPDATVRATARALARVDDAAAVVLVEGVSDQIALETAAAGRGRDLAAERVVIMPIGGAHAIGRYLARLNLTGPDLTGPDLTGPDPTTPDPARDRRRLAGLCDLREEEIFRRGLVAAGIGSPRTRADMERLGFYVCVGDLEDELIRAVGTVGVEALLDAQDDLRPFRSFQKQPAWRGRAAAAQLYRFLRSSSVRNLRYARLLVEAAIARDALPRPLDALLAAV
jgi:hypothetical protein